MVTKLSPFLIRPCGAPSPRGKVFSQALRLSNANLSSFRFCLTAPIIFLREQFCKRAAAIRYDLGGFSCRWGGKRNSTGGRVQHRVEFPASGGTNQADWSVSRVFSFTNPDANGIIETVHCPGQKAHRLSRRSDQLVFVRSCCHCEPVRTLVWQSPC